MFGSPKHQFPLPRARANKRSLLRTSSVSLEVQKPKRTHFLWPKVSIYQVISNGFRRKILRSGTTTTTRDVWRYSHQRQGARRLLRNSKHYVGVHIGYIPYNRKMQSITASTQTNRTAISTGKYTVRCVLNFFFFFKYETVGSLTI